MTNAVMNPVKTFALIALGLAIAAIGIYVADADDAPGAAVGGLLLILAGVVLGIGAARNRLPVWAARTAFAVGVAVAAFLAFVLHQVVVTAPLFPGSQGVPSVVDSAPPPQYAVAVERARQLVQAAIVEENLPGVSVAVGAGGTVVWAEGFGWRDVAARAPVTPATRFNIGSAASAVADSVAPLGLTNTGSDPVTDWSPSHLGEPEEDFPLFTLIRHVVFRPLGLAPDQPLKGNRATFYVPSWWRGCRRRATLGQYRMRTYWTAIATLLCVAGGCSRSVPNAPELATTATIKDLMDAMVDPNAEYLFDNIVEIVDETGIIDKTPKTDDEWKEVRRRALMLVEAPNLLVAPGRKVAKPGEKPEYPEVELGPEQIQKLIDDDRDAFVRRARRLQDSALLALKAIDARDKKDLFAKLGEVDKACESCHLHYWYPNDKRAQQAAKEDGVD